MRSKFKRQRGDEEFVELASARGAHLLRTAYLLTGDWHLGEDLVQEALGKMFVAWRGVDTIDNPAAYVQTVLVRTYLSHRRRRSAGELPHAEVPEAVARESDVALRVSLMNGLAQLEMKDRAVIVLRYWEDRSVNETAEVLGLSAAAVRNRSLRALAKLRGILGPRFLELVDGGGDADAESGEGSGSVIGTGTGPGTGTGTGTGTGASVGPGTSSADAAKTSIPPTTTAMSSGAAASRTPLDEGAHYVTR